MEVKQVSSVSIYLSELLCSSQTETSVCGLYSTGLKQAQWSQSLNSLNLFISLQNLMGDKHNRCFLFFDLIFFQSLTVRIYYAL